MICENTEKSEKMEILGGALGKKTIKCYTFLRHRHVHQWNRTYSSLSFLLRPEILPKMPLLEQQGTFRNGSRKKGEMTKPDPP